MLSGFLFSIYIRFWILSQKSRSLNDQKRKKNLIMNEFKIYEINLLDENRLITSRTHANQLGQEK